ncbi:uncharacterized protein LOC142069968 [Caretta caretta]|uniref:uncharacterized protein LOC142069968 n=1 Tax=Caretta caretta TaxID=8467 RepID=UPI003F4C0CE5
MWVALPLCMLAALLATEGSPFSYTGKSCLEPKNCEPGPFSLTYAHNVTVRVNIACCDTDGCNAGAIPVPTVSSVPNGRQCQMVFIVDRFDRQPVGILAGTGTEDHCVEESGILTLGDMTVKKAVAGCGSPGACMKREGERKYAQGVVQMLIRAECYPAPRAGGGIGEPEPQSGVLPFCCESRPSPGTGSRVVGAGFHLGNVPLWMADSGVRMEFVGKTSERKTRGHVPRLNRGEQGLELRTPTAHARGLASGAYGPGEPGLEGIRDRRSPSEICPLMEMHWLARPSHCRVSVLEQLLRPGAMQIGHRPPV